MHLRHSLLLIPAILAAASSWAAIAPEQIASARDLMRERKFKESRAAFERLAAADPKHAQVQYHLGEIALNERRWDDAISHLEKAVQNDPAKSDYYLELGGAYGSKAQDANIFSQARLAGKSRSALEKAVELDPKSVRARLGLMQYYTQAPAIVGGGMDKAYAQAEEIRKIDPARGRTALAGLYVSDKKFDEAFALYDEILKTSLDDYSALYQLGRLAAMSGQRLDTGADALKRCLSMTAPPDQPGHAAARWRLGNIREKQGDTAAARAEYEASLRLEPEFRQAKDSLSKLK